MDRGETDANREGRPVRPPVYLIAGHGRRGRDPLLAEALEACGAAKPSVAYVGAASGDDPAFYSRIAADMRSCGAGKVTLVPLAGSWSLARRGGAYGRPAAAALEAADVVFFSGGDVAAGMAVLERSGMVPLLRRLFRGGKPFFGISAGSIMLGRRWVRWVDPSDDESAKPFDCLGFAPLVCDTHGEEEGWAELVTLLRHEGEGTIGYGIPAGCALRVSHDGAIVARGGAVHRFVRRGRSVERLEDLTPQ